MARTKYYTDPISGVQYKRKRTREAGFGDIPPWLQVFIIIAFIIIIIWAYLGDKVVFGLIQQYICLVLPVGILLIIVAGWALLKYFEYRKKLEAELIFQVKKRIEEFQPSRNWSSEEGYQAELQGVLKTHFPNSKVEIQTGASRPDIVIDDIAIEIKGPTDDTGIDSLGTKCLKYTQHYPHLIIVLFQCSFSESNYNEVMKGIQKYFPGVQVVRK